ncbi:MAG TPA: hypothetical protein VG937_10720 [Polyangiaceae bacterium]|nr:hypothetical protein [Polyangiaceae bacterium]
MKNLTRDDGAKCKLARERRAGIVAKDEAAQKAKDARCATLKLAQDQCTQRCESRAPKDDLGFADFDKGLDCRERCEKQVPLSGCD